jgi:hypothetical protein
MTRFRRGQMGLTESHFKLDFILTSQVGLRESNFRRPKSHTASIDGRRHVGFGGGAEIFCSITVLRLMTRSPKSDLGCA